MNEESTVTQPLATLAELLKTDRVIISPEGVEELLKAKIGMFITLTAGGKYRVYVAESEHQQTMCVVDTLKEAKERAFNMLGLRCAFHVAPAEVLKTMLDGLHKDK